MRADRNKEFEIAYNDSGDRFGYEWAHYNKILPESRLQLRRWLGSTGLDGFKGKRVLDVGCGMGRNSYWMAQAGATQVTAVDIDENCVEATKVNLSGFSNVEVSRCSAYDLDPSKLGLYDRVTCIGVLHHLSDPNSALRSMWSCVKPGGDLILWCYAREGNSLFLPIIQILRGIGSHLPISVTHGLAKLLSRLLWPALRILPWRTRYYRNLGRSSFKNIECIIFDQILPRIAHYWTRKDIETIISILDGLSTVEFVQDNSWHIRIQKVPRAI